MYHHLLGELCSLGPTHAVIEAGGIGFELRIPLSAYRALRGQEGQRIRLFTHLQVLEDAHRLYGFHSRAERDLFQVITSISGVGPATALALLGTFEPAEFAAAISSGDATVLKRVKGVGPKLSERIILELKDRTEELLDLAGAPSRTGGARVPPRVDPAVAKAVGALINLGYQRREAQEKAERVLSLLLARGGDDRAGPDVGEIVQGVLQLK